MAVMATPAKVLAVLPPVTASAVSLKLPPNRADTEAPEGAAVSSLTAAKLAFSVVATGASFWGVTVTLTVSVMLLESLPLSVTVQVMLAGCRLFAFATVLYIKP